jgi:DNA-binding transcriptional LysR family regulator
MDAVMRNLDIDLLRALVAIADCSCFSGAAAQLGRTQSAVSLQIKRLEQAVGQSLLQRCQGRVTGPTAEGRVLIDYGRRILRLNDEAYSCFAQPTLVGRLRLGLPEELMESVFPRVLAAFTQACPRVDVSVRCDLSVRLSTHLDDGELDLAIVKRVAANSTSKDDPSWRLIRREPLIWLAGEGSDAPQRRPLPLALFHEGCVFRMAALAALAAAGLAWKQVFVGNSYTGIHHAVACGLAVTPLPQSLAREGLVPIRDGLPPLPEAELAARFGVGEPLPAALRMLELFEEHLLGRPSA